MNEAALQTKHKVNKEQALKLRFQGKTYQEIADVYGVTKAAIHQQLKPLMGNGVDVEEYKNNKANLIHSIAAQTLYAMSKDKADESSYSNLGSTYAKLNEQALLEEGRATHIIETRSFHVHASASKLFKTV